MLFLQSITPAFDLVIADMPFSLLSLSSILSPLTELEPERLEGEEEEGEREGVFVGKAIVVAVVAFPSASASASAWQNDTSVDVPSYKEDTPFTDLEFNFDGWGPSIE